MRRCRRASSMPTSSWPRTATNKDAARSRRGCCRRLRAADRGTAACCRSPAQIEFSAEQIMLGGRPLQNLSGRTAWRRRVLGDRPAGSARARHDAGVLHQPRARRAAHPAISPARSTSTPPIRMRWWPGCRAGATSPSQPEAAAPARRCQRGRGRVAIEALKAEIDGGAVEGRIALSAPPAGGGSRVEAELKAERLDLDAAGAFMRSLAGREAIGRRKRGLARHRPRHVGRAGAQAVLRANSAYNPKTISLDRLKIGQPGGVTVEGSGSFDRADATGKLALNATAASLGQITRWSRRLRRQLASRLDALRTPSGPARAETETRPRKRRPRAGQSCQRARRARPRRAAAQGHGDRTAKPQSTRSAASISRRSAAAK